MVRGKAHHYNYQGSSARYPTISPVLRSTMEAKRWTKVPRRVSWPVNRTVRPSSSSEPRARISPVALLCGAGAQEG